MSYPIIGLRVVRGPDWKWGDQDGGEGCAGTVTNIAQPGPSSRSVTVVWDSGFKGYYRVGPSKGSYDLRIIDNPAGERHRNVTCGHADCSTKVIRGLRWKCVDCELNLCTSCYLKKVPHRKDHNTFQRFDNPQVTDPETVSIQPRNRIKLIGLFPGAEVIKGPVWPFGREDEVNIGVVCSDLTEKIGEFLVDWYTTNERCSVRRNTPNGKPRIRPIKMVVGGFYSPECLPVLKNSVDAEEQPQSSLPVISALFSLGDRILVDPGIKRKGVKNHLSGAVGTVVDFLGNKIVVQFPTMKQHLDQEFLRKLNRFSVNDIIRIRDDKHVLRQIEKEFGRFEIGEEKLGGSVGRVTGIDMKDALKVYVKFDQDYDWLDKGKSLPSSWIEKHGTIQPAFDQEIETWISKGSELFLKAVEIGDLRSAQLLFKKDKSVADAARNADGKNALHLACLKGYKDIVRWLIDDVGIDIEKTDPDGFRPIHRAVKESHLEVLEILLQRYVQLDVLTLQGDSPLQIAVKNQLTEIVRLLVDRGCDVNVKDRFGRTPLFTAIYYGKVPAIIQLLVSTGRINWDLKDGSGFNGLQLAVVKNDLKAIQLILDYEDRGLVFDLFPDTQSTVLHYACFHRNIKVAKLLLNHLKGAEEIPSVPNRLEQLLEVRNTRKMTALLIAVGQRDHTLIELLVGAGADVKATDENGDTALILAATNPSNRDCNPPMNLLSPALLQVLEKHPALFFVGYLIERGFSWITANYSGLKPADYLASEGYPLDAIEQLDGLASKVPISIRRASGGTACMKQDVCIHPPAFQVTCPHKPCYKACSKCFLKRADEEITSIVPMTAPFVTHEVIQLMSGDGPPIKTEPIESEEDFSSNSEEEEAQLDNNEEEPTSNSFYSIRWFSDASKNGYCKDDIGNKYFHWSTRNNGSITYRCIEVSAGKRCPGTASKLGRKIFLEIPHEHFSIGKRKEKKDDSSVSDGSPIPKRKKWN